MSDVFIYIILPIFAIIGILFATYRIGKIIFILTSVLITFLLLYFGPVVAYIWAYTLSSILSPHTYSYTVEAKDLNPEILANFNQLDTNKVTFWKLDDDENFLRIEAKPDSNSSFYWDNLAISSIEFTNNEAFVNLEQDLIIDGIVCNYSARFTQKGNKQTYTKSNFEFNYCTGENIESEITIGDNILKSHVDVALSNSILHTSFLLNSKKLKRLVENIKNANTVEFSNFTNPIALNGQYLGNSIQILRGENQETKLMFGRLVNLDEQNLKLGECHYADSTEFIATNFQNGEATFFFDPDVVETNCSEVSVPFKLSFFDIKAYEAKKILPLKNQSVNEIPKNLLSSFSQLEPSTEVTWNIDENRITNIVQSSNIFYWHNIPLSSFVEEKNKIQLYPDISVQRNIKIANQECSIGGFLNTPIVLERKNSAIHNSLKLEDFELSSCRNVKTVLNLENNPIPFYLAYVQFNHPQGILVSPSNIATIGMEDTIYSTFELHIADSKFSKDEIYVTNILADRKHNIVAINGTFSEESSLYKACKSQYENTMVKANITDFKNNTALFTISEIPYGSDEVIKSCKSIRLPYKIKEQKEKLF